MASEDNKHRKITERAQFRFIVSFLALIAALLVCLNSYPLISSRDVVFSEKENSLQSQASVISSALSTLDDLSTGAVSQVMALLDVTDVTRMIVTDESGLVVYDTASPSSQGDYAMFSEISRALECEQVFWSSFAEGAFVSRAAMPVRNAGRTIGAVYLCERDEAQAALILSIQAQMRVISLAVCAAALVLTLVFSQAFTRRITRLAQAIRVVRGGNYAHRIETDGNDELAELADEFNTLTERLQVTEEQRRRFVSDASHELKTPLAAIRLLSDSIVQTGNMDMATVREFVADIGTEADRLQRTSEKLLDLSRRDHGVKETVSVVDVGDVARNTLRLLNPLAAERGVSIDCAAADGCLVLASPDELYQIIFNLVENAVKYNVDGGKVCIGIFRRDGEVCLRVEDTGIGIPEADMPQIFSRFYRVDKARSREHGGSGLGLSIVHDAVEALGGGIEVSARAERGTRFLVRFPEAKPEEGAET